MASGALNGLLTSAATQRSVSSWTSRPMAWKRSTQRSQLLLCGSPSVQRPSPCVCSATPLPFFSARHWVRIVAAPDAWLRRSLYTQASSSASSSTAPRLEPWRDAISVTETAASNLSPLLSAMVKHCSSLSSTMNSITSLGEHVFVKAPTDTCMHAASASGARKGDSRNHELHAVQDPVPSSADVTTFSVGARASRCTRRSPCGRG
mmetsp:Transcript_71919/g.168339  ORF Transcript_71919/g.168339 Transcript_71919/m.168339 type:complete len:206 (-) Transcript_71919:447-1064(-)